MATTRSQYALATCAGFVLDQIRMGRGFLDFGDALILVAVTQANVESLMRDPILQRTYAAYDAPPPDELRRPISINAVAQSLGLPLETVRRRVARLSLVGVFRAGSEGVWTPTSRLGGDRHRQAAEAGYGRILALYAKLADLEELAELPVGTAWTGAPPLRAAARLSAEYLLRLVDQLTSLLGAPTDAAIWLEILRSSTADGLGGVAEPASLAREPVARQLIAKRLGLPAETVRRRLANLVAQGVCETAGHGVVVPAEVLARPAFLGLADRNLADLRRMFAGVAQLGVLAPRAGIQAAA